MLQGKTVNLSLQQEQRNILLHISRPTVIQMNDLCKRKLADFLRPTDDVHVKVF